MKFPDRETVARLRREFPAGCRIVLDEMEDPYVKIPAGTQGTCRGVDDAGSMERRLRIPEGDGKRLLIALDIGLINCLPQIIDHVHDTASRMMDDGYSLDIRLGAFSLKFGRND